MSSTWLAGSRNGLSKISQATSEFLKKGGKNGWLGKKMLNHAWRKSIIADEGWEAAMKWASPNLLVTGSISQSISSHSSLPHKASLFCV